jgi:carbonic anhydrase
MRFPDRLITGYAAFASGRLASEQSRFRELAERGQSPEIMMIGCCDSRVSPEVIFDARPGEMFVLRNIANLVPPYSPDDRYHGVSSAIEYGVNILKVKYLIVLGHAQCGGVRAFADSDGKPAGATDFIGQWISLIGPAASRAKANGDTGDFITRLEQASVLQSIDNLLTFPFVVQRVQAGLLELHGAYFGVASGQLSIFDKASGRFVPVKAS